MAHGAKWNIHMHKWILQKHHNKSLIPKIPCVRTVNSSFGFSFCLYYILLIACVIWCEWSSAGRCLGRAGQVKVSHWRFMRSVWLYENSRLYENSWMRLPLKWVKMGTFPWRRANTGGGGAVVTRGRTGCRDSWLRDTVTSSHTAPHHSRVHTFMTAPRTLATRHKTECSLTSSAREKLNIEKLYNFEKIHHPSNYSLFEGRWIILNLEN